MLSRKYNLSVLKCNLIWINCEQVVEVRRVSDRVMAVIVVFDEDGLRLICGYDPQSERCFEENQFFMMN